MLKRFISVRAVLIFVLCNILLLLSLRKDDTYVLSVIHINDFHDRFDEITKLTTPCRPKMTDCIGGFSRTYTKISQLRKSLDDPLLLNLGDNFVGSLWYKHYRWNVTQYFMNLLNFNVTTIGNHEFDYGIDDVIHFVKAMNSPFVLTNVDANDEPEFNKYVKKSVVLERQGKRIGFIGLLIKGIKKGRLRKLTLVDEIETVRRESERLKKLENCDIIIILSHCGRDIDEKIAIDGGPYISLIIGAHTHDLYHNGKLPAGIDGATSEYPGVFKQPSGHNVLIVQANCVSKFVGHITIHFDGQNKPIYWQGNTDFLGTDQPKDPKIDKLLSHWKVEIDQIAYEVIGQAVNKLDGAHCRLEECNIGNLFTDILVDEAIRNGQPADIISLFSSGGIKGSINSGDILYMDLIGAMPFDDHSMMFDIKGQYLLETLQIASKKDFRSNATCIFAPELMQVGGLSYTVNVSKPNLNNIESIQTYCKKCPNGSRLKPLDLAKNYRIITPEYFLDPVDGFLPLVKNYKNPLRGNKLIDTMKNYISKHSPIQAFKLGRLKIIR